MKKNFSLRIAIFLFFLSGGLFLLRKPLVSFFKENLVIVKVGELLSEQKVRQIKSQTGKWQKNAPQAVFLNRPVSLPLAEFPVEERVLGERAAQEKWIEIDLSEQRLRAWEGNTLVYNFLTSTGKWGRTPQGEFRIWIKMRYCLMDGGSVEDGTYYYLPNVPYVMYFHGAYGIHGTYWHNNFGTPMSHGCVNLSIPDAGTLFAWTEPPVLPDKSLAYPTKENPGTRVIIHE